MTRQRVARQYVLSLAFAMTLGMLGAPSLGVRVARASALPLECAQVSSTVTCTYTTGDNAFTVPVGVSSIHVIAIGGKGGWNDDPSSQSASGRGAIVTADVAVSPGSSLHAVVAGNGSGSAAGSNGGGSGGSGGSCHGAGGGGASDIRTDTTLASRILVAGGGGGAGCPGLSQGGIPLYWFSSGGDAGADGDPGADFGDPTVGLGGGAGCGTSADVGCGTGGIGGEGTVGGQSGDPGTDGAFGQGGAGGGLPDHGGAGGGGGWYGGGGGGAGGQEYIFLGDISSGGSGAGGGGGSSLVPEGGSLSIDTTGVPSIEISYSVPTTFNVASAASTGNTSMTVTFDSPPDSTEAATLANYDVPGLTLSGPPLVSGSTVTLATSAQTTQSYTVTVSNITRASDVVPLTTDTASFAGTGPALPIIVFPASTPPDAEVGQAYEYDYAAYGDVGLTYSETGTLPPGLSLSSLGVVSGTPTASGEYPIQVTATGTSGAQGSHDDILVVVDAPSADLTASISAAPKAAKIGHRLTYSITVRNAGPATAAGIVVRDSLSSMTGFVSATATAGSCVSPVVGTSGDVVCSLASLASGASLQIQVVVTVNAKSVSITNTVSVTTSANDPTLANNDASVTTRGK